MSFTQRKSIVCGLISTIILHTFFHIHTRSFNFHIQKQLKVLESQKCKYFSLSGISLTLNFIGVLSFTLQLNEDGIKPISIYLQVFVLYVTHRGRFHLPTIYSFVRIIL